MEDNFDRKFRLISLIAVVVAVLAIAGIAAYLVFAKSQIDARNAKLQLQAEAYETSGRMPGELDISSGKNDSGDAGNTDLEENDSTSSVVSGSGDASIVIICTDCTTGMPLEVKPLLDKYGYSATIVVSEDYFDESLPNMKLADLTAMAEAGWSVALGLNRFPNPLSNESIENDAAQRKALSDMLAEDGIPAADSVYYFDQRKLCSLSGSVIASASGGSLATRTDIGLATRTDEANTEAFTIASTGSNERVSKQYVLSAIQQGTALGLTVGFSDSREIFESVNFESMLKFLQRYDSAKLLEVTNIADAEQRCGPASVF